VQPDQTADQPGIHLHAASSLQHSDAETVIGSADGQVKTTATAGVVNAEVAAHAEVIIGDLNTGSLRISGMRSAATLTRRADGTIKRDNELTVASASISGTPISIGGGGITAANTAIPIPGAGSLGDLPIGSGIAVRVLAGQSTDTSVMSPALVITTPFTSLTDKPGTATYVIGRASAFLDLVAPRLPPTAIAPAAAVPGASTPIAATSVPAAGSTVSPSPGGNAAPVRATGSIASVRGAPIAWQLRTIYVAFVIAALALTAGNAALRHLGVRS
jgi:hypothetical protein